MDLIGTIFDATILAYPCVLTGVAILKRGVRLFRPHEGRQGTCSGTRPRNFNALYTFHACNVETAERICELLELEGHINDYVRLY